jgi:hypothetical protein
MEESKERSFNLQPAAARFFLRETIRSDEGKRLARGLKFGLNCEATPTDTYKSCPLWSVDW